MLIFFIECNFIENIRNVLDLTKLLRFGILQTKAKTLHQKPELLVRVAFQGVNGGVLRPTGASEGGGPCTTPLITRTSNTWLQALPTHGTLQPTTTCLGSV